MRICKNKFTDHLWDVFDANPQQQSGPIPFAIGCMELKIGDNGNFKAGGWLENSRSFKKCSETSNQKILKKPLDDDSFQPLFIDKIQ